MRGEAEFTVPELIRVVSTRAAIGVGLGLVLADSIPKNSRRAVGWTMLLGGVFSATAFALEVFGQPKSFTLRFDTKASTREHHVETTERFGEASAFAGG
jgi:hypothetical protein